MELMSQGDLKSFLLKHRPEMSTDPSLKPPKLKVLIVLEMSYNYIIFSLIIFFFF